MSQNPYEAPKTKPFRQRRLPSANPQIVAMLFAAVILVVLAIAGGVIVVAAWMLLTRPLF